MKSIYSLFSSKEKWMKGTFFGCAFFSIIALILIALYLFINGVPFIAKIGVGNFIFSDQWAPLSDNPLYGIGGMIVATLYLTALAVFLGVTVGLLSSICLYKFCYKKLVPILRQLINLLAGIPSVIYGLFGLIVIVPFVRDYIAPDGVGAGFGIFSTSIVLAIMILPTIISCSLDALYAVPNSYFEGALALGATKEQTTFKILVPAAKSGIFAGIVLAIGRAIGETMAVAMIIGGSADMPNSLFQSVRTLTTNIAAGAMELQGDAHSALVATGVVLFVFSLLLNISFSCLKEISNKDKKKGKTNEK